MNEEICFHSKNRNKKEIFQENIKNAHGNIYQIKDFIENAMNLEMTISRTIQISQNYWHFENIKKIRSRD